MVVGFGDLGVWGAVMLAVGGRADGGLVTCGFLGGNFVLAKFPAVKRRRDELSVIARAGPLVIGGMPEPDVVIDAVKGTE